MNSILQVKLNFANERNPSKPNGRELRTHSELSAEKVDALIEGLSQNQDFFTLLLQNEEIKKEVLGIFADEIYKSLREEAE